jgi:hypothetical protein
MKILLACYHTSILYNLLRSNGHKVVSCDLKPPLHNGEHYQGDVFDIINSGFDMMIGFPPCTYLCKAQEFRIKKEPDRKKKQVSAARFVDQLFHSSIPRIALENPVGYLSRAWLQPNQIVRPWFFGDPYGKEICLWLKDMPPLISTLYNPVRKSISNHVNGRMNQAQKSEIRSSWNYYPGMCQAIADQWCPQIPDVRSLDGSLLVYPMAASLTVKSNPSKS